MNRSLFLGLIIFLLVKGLKGQENSMLLDKVISTHKELQIDSMEIILTELEPQKLKQFFQYELEFLKKGERVDASFLNLNGLDGRNRYVGMYILADLVSRVRNKPDSTVFNFYKRAFKLARIQKDTLIINEVLERINRFLFINGSQQNTFDHYLKLFQDTAKDSVDNFYVNYHQIGYEFLQVEDNPTSIDSIKIEKLFSRASKYASNPFFQASLNGYKSIFYSACMKNQ
ncbi:MAG: hypothetical protein AAF039_18710 [Bacteroidota bacterium]